MPLIWLRERERAVSQGCKDQYHAENTLFETKQAHGLMQGEQLLKLIYGNKDELEA